MNDSPDWVTVTPGETVVWESHPAPGPYLMTLGGEVLLIAVGLLLWLGGGLDSLLGVSFNPTIPVVQLSLWSLVAVLLIVWGLVGIGRTAIRWRSIHYLITSEEIYVKSGIVSRSVHNTRLEEVQNTSFTQSWLGRLLGYGDIAIDTAGTGGKEIVFTSVPQPREVLEMITRQLDEAKSQSPQE